MNKILALTSVSVVAGLAGCSTFSNLGQQLNEMGSSLQRLVSQASNTEVVYKSPNVTRNGIFVLGSTWAQLNSHLQTVRDKETGAVSYQAVVAVTYMLQGQFKQVRNYQWANVELSSGTALQTMFIQDSQDSPVLGRSISDCNPVGVCKQEILTVALDENLLKRANNDLLVQVHAGRDSNKVPLHPAVASFKPAYVASFLRAAGGASATGAARE